MKLNVNLQSVLVEIISLLYIVLFVYAAFNKILDFENFQVQIAQSPLLSSFATWISWLVPILELTISVLLCIPKMRLLALYCSFSLMFMFSIYIVTMLNFSPFVPCSCGGILDNFSWNQHLIFNVIYTVIAIPAIIFTSTKKGRDKKIFNPFLLIGILSLLSCTIVTILFLISEDMLHHRNNFTRRYPNHPAEFFRDFTLPTRSNYFAGIWKGTLYFGNISNPLQIIEVDSSLTVSKTHTLVINDPNRLYRTLRVTVQYPYFYLSDGTEAFVYRGLVNHWKAEIWIDKKAYFNSFVPIDYNTVAIRSISSEKNENVLGILKKADSTSVMFNPKLLDKQIDGIFDTDGMLIYNKQIDKLIYIYSYRNEYLITDTKLNSKFVGRTIDTTTHANIKIAYIKSIKASKLASPARTVNKTAATFGNNLYINSQLIGQHEPKDMWNEASIIDIYKLTTHTYQFSLYLYDKGQKKISEFLVDEEHIYTLSGKILTIYKLDKKAFEKN